MESLELENSRMKDKLEKARQSIATSNAQKQQLVDQYSSSEEIPRPLSDTAATDQGGKPGCCLLRGVSESRRENILLHISSHVDSVRPHGIVACSLLAEERARHTLMLRVERRR